MQVVRIEKVGDSCLRSGCPATKGKGDLELVTAPTNLQERASQFLHSPLNDVKDKTAKCGLDCQDVEACSI